jgi:NNP family nitrate/nitrite transporter-like MFS transporter
VVLVAAALYWSFTFTDHAHHRRDSLAEMLSPLKHVRVWRFSLYYFLVFGGYVALSLWLPKYYIDVFGLSLKQAALLTAVFVFPSGIIRAPGGWLSDRYGARSVMYWVLGTCVVTSFILAFPDAEIVVPFVGKHAGAAPWRLSYRMDPSLFTALVFVLGIAMGIGKAAVYKHIPHYFPTRVGAVGGLVGVIGGLGGFVMPILFGALAEATRLPTTTFLFLFALSTCCMIWMIAVVKRMTREAAPRVAEELDFALRPAPALVPALPASPTTTQRRATGGE